MSKISGAQIALGLQPGKAMSPYDMYRLKNYIEHSERENARRKSELEAIKTQKEEQRKLEVVQKTVMAQHDSRKTDNTATTIKTPTLAPVVEKTTFEPPKLGNYLQPLPVVKQTEQSGVSQNGAMLAQVANKVKEYENALSEYESLGSQLGYHENPSKRIDENWQIVLDWYEMPVPGQDSPKQNERFRELGSQLSTGMEDYKKRRALLDENYMSPEEVYRKTQYNEAVVLATTESEKDLDFAYKSRVVMGDHGYSTLGNDLKYLTDEKNRISKIASAILYGSNNRYSLLDQMTDDEKQNYIFLANTDEKKAADYFNLIERTLTSRRAEAQTQNTAQLVENSPVAAALTARASSMASPFAFAETAAQGVSNLVTGENAPVDTNRGAFAALRVRDQLDSGVLAKLESSDNNAMRYLAYIYEPAMKTIDTAVISTFGPAAPYIFAAQQAGETSYRKTLAGSPIGDALFVAFVEGGEAFMKAKLSEYVIKNFANGIREKLAERALARAAKNGDLIDDILDDILDIGDDIVDDWYGDAVGEGAGKAYSGKPYSGTRNPDVDFNNAKGYSTAQSHFDRHGADFDSVDDYVSESRNFLEKPPTSTTQSFVSSDGTYFRYDTVTNEFLVLNKYGGVSTYFKPETGLSYWLDQINKYAPK